MILTGAADGRVAPKAAVDRKEGWRGVPETVKNGNSFPA